MDAYAFKIKDEFLTSKDLARREINRSDTVQQRGDFGSHPSRGDTVQPVRRVGSDSGPGGIAKTPSGGIPAMSLNSPGKAVCDIWVHGTSGDLENSGETIELENVMTSAIAGNTTVLYSIRDGVPTVDTEDCPQDTGATAPTG